MFEWLDIFKRQKRNKRPSTMWNTSNLHEQLRHVRHLSDIRYEVRKVSLLNEGEHLNLTDIILKEKKEGLFVAILSDSNGNRSHAVGIDAGRQVIYNCMVKNELQLNE